MQGRRLQIIVKGFGEHVRISGAESLKHVGVDLRLRFSRKDVLSMPVAVQVQLPIHVRGGHPKIRESENPLELTLREGRAQLVAAARADRGTPDEGERHVRAELRRKLEKLFAPEVGAPERVTGQKGGGSIRRSPAHSARDRNMLLDLEMHPAAIPGLAGDEHGGADGEVGRIRRQIRRVDRTRESHREPIGGHRPHVFAQRNGLVGGGEIVKAVVEERPHLEEDVDLARSPRVYHFRGRGDAHETNLAEGRDGPKPAVYARAMARKWSTVSRSPRSVGSIPARISAADAEAASPKTGASDWRSILRRC